MPYLILVEGPSDVEFFRGLLKDRNLNGLYDVRCPQDSEYVSGSGNTRFREALNGFALNEGFDSLRGVLVVTDSDTDPNASFVAVQKQIEATERRHPAPPSLMEKSEGDLPIVVLTIPWIDEPGTLETLCLRAAESAPENATVISCVDDFQACAGIDNWSLNKVSRFRLRAIIAATYQRNPDLSLAHVWKNIPERIPLSHQSFDKIADFLKSFPYLIAS